MWFAASFPLWTAVIIHWIILYLIWNFGFLCENNCNEFFGLIFKKIIPQKEWSWNYEKTQDHWCRWLLIDCMLSNAHAAHLNLTISSTEQIVDINAS